MKPNVLVLTTGIDKGRLAVLESVAAMDGYRITVCRFTRWWWPRELADRVEVVESTRWGVKLPFGLFNDDVYVHLDPTILFRILSHEWDIVVLYGYGSLTSLFAAVVAKSIRIPVIMWSDARLDYEKGRAKWVWRYKTILHRLSSGFLASGTAAKLFLQQTGVSNEQISIAPYAIDNDKFLGRFAHWKCIADETRRGLGIQAESPVLLYVGRMVKPKGVEDLLRASKEVQAAGHVFHVVLVGDGADRNYFESVAATIKLARLHFIGSVPQCEIGKYYAIADWFVLPSHRDVWAKVVNEALLFGIPVIASCDVGAHYDLVLEGITGFTYKTRDIGALSRQLEYVVAKPAVRRELSANTSSVITGWSISAAARAVEYRLDQARCAVRGERT